MRCLINPVFRREEAEAWVHGPDILCELCVSQKSFTMSLMEFSFPLHIPPPSPRPPCSEPSWCSQDQRITLDHHLYWFIVPGFLIQSVSEEKSFSSHDFVWDHMNHVCVCAPVGFQQFVCICGVWVALLKMLPSVHLCRVKHKTLLSKTFYKT